MKNRMLLVFLAMVLVVSLAAFGACAKEEPVEFSLKITAVGEGTTSPAPGTSTITEGESVTVTATPNPGYELDRWEGDVSGTTNPITFKMKSDMSVVAVFVEGVPAWEWPDTFFIGTTGTASNNYATALSWATPMEADTGMKIRLVCEDSPTSLQLALRRKTVDTCTWGGITIGLLYAEESQAIRDGGPFQIRYIYCSSVADSGFAVRGDSGIKTPRDIKPGHKITYFTFLGEKGKSQQEALLAWGGLTKEDVIWVPVANPSAAARALIDGKADIIFAYPNSPPQIEAEAAPHGLDWIELNPEKDPEGAKVFLELQPNMSLGRMSTGVPSAHGKWGFVAVNGYAVYADLDAEFVYNTVKWLHENYEKYKLGTPECQTMTIDNLMVLAEISFKPIHEGAVKYLKELGLWTDAHEKRQQQNIDLMTRWVEAYQDAIKLADDNGIVVSPMKDEWLALWEDYKKELGLPEFKLFPGLD